uniref:Uncharacterized protein n=1 Tax=viral metagenome TaxID=1070528 RepID=A0A6C0FCX2_9ZZZZ|tara:strand:+ start:35820 stop:36479 length:660 start_codon:yes stop_codon:yes gene_type:complete
MSQENININEESSVIEEDPEYTIIPKYKKSFVETEHYTKLLESDRVAHMTKTIVWRWGECSVWLNEQEKKELLSKETVNLVDYQCEFIESSDGCVVEYSLEDEDHYTISDLKEIVMSVSEDVPDDFNNKLEAENTGDEESLRKKLLEGIYEYCNSSDMEDIGDWDMIDTFYVIEGGCVLVPEGENVEDYGQDDGTYANPGNESTFDVPDNVFSVDIASK